MALNQQQKQRATGYMFGILAIFMSVVSIVAFANEGPVSAIFPIILVVFLGFLSWRQLQPGTDESVPTADERTHQTVILAGNQALWILVIVMMVQLSFDFIPTDFVTSSYLLVGMAAYGVFGHITDGVGYQDKRWMSTTSLRSIGKVAI